MLDYHFETRGWRRRLTRTIVPIVVATIETIVRHSTPKSNCVEALIGCCQFYFAPTGSLFAPS